MSATGHDRHEGGLVIAEATRNARQPFYGNPVKAKLRSIIRQAEAICRAGTSLNNTVLIRQRHLDLADLPTTLEVWDQAMSHAPLPLSLIEAPRRANSGRSLGLCSQARPQTNDASRP